MQSPGLPACPFSHHTHTNIYGLDCVKSVGVQIPMPPPPRDIHVHHTEREYTNRNRDPGGMYIMCTLGIHHTDPECTTLRYSDIACVSRVDI